MLGWQDFCGYYEWTFNYLRQTYGAAALQRYWAEAIAIDSQQHYVRQGKDDGLRGLQRAWSKSGDEEQCDWKLTLDDQRQTLRLDMYNCPSKGYLLTNNLNADEDYCDHCIGWIDPALQQSGMQVAAHEHNHCGQCWWVMTPRAVESTSRHEPGEIRDSASWSCGYVDRFIAGTKELAGSGESHVDPVAALEDHFSAVSRIVVIDAGASSVSNPSLQADDGVIATGARYAAEPMLDAKLTAVLLSDAPNELAAVAARYLACEPAERPRLLFHYLPTAIDCNFVQLGLPRPWPILPCLIRRNVYVHDPEAPPPSATVFAVMVAIALDKTVVLRDIALGAADRSSSSRVAGDLQWLATLNQRHGAKLDLPTSLAEQLP